MRVEVIMPQMGESIVEGTVVDWLKKPGDRVKRDEDIFTISTDKVDADIPSPSDGVLKEVLVEVGDTVEVGSVVAYIETEEEERDEAEDRAADETEAEAEADAEAEAEARAEAPGEAEEGAEDEDRGSAETTDAVPRAAERSAPPARPAEGDGDGAAASPSPTQEQARPAPSSGDGQPTVDELRRTRSTPLVRKIAREHGISDLSVVPGTGISGRVTKHDILEFIEKQKAQDRPTKATPAARETAEEPARGEGKAPRRTLDEAPPSSEAPRVHIWDDDRLEPMSRMRRAIARRMVESRRISAHCQSVWDCDWTRVVEARRQLKPQFAEKGVKLTYTAFLVEAAVHALSENPIVNASVDGDRIVYRNRINVGVAVAIADGLIVPVVKHADELSLLGIARAVNDLGERARNRQLKLDEVEGGTFTISNPGVFGSRFGIPIINQPEVAILGVGAIEKRVVAGDDDSIRVVTMNTMCLTFDHRIIDGATADEFMRSYVDFIESYEP